MDTIKISSTSIVSIITLSVLNNLFGVAVFVLVTGFVVFINYILTLYAIKIYDTNPRKTSRQKGQFRESLFPQNSIYYVFGKLIAYAGLMAACTYIDSIAGNTIPVLASFKTLVLVAEIHTMETVLKRGYGIDVSFVGKILNYLKLKKNEAVHPARHKKFQK